MDLSQDVLLPLLLVTVVANAAIVVILLASGRIGRKRVATAGTTSTFDDAIMSSSYGDRSADASWPTASGPLEEPIEAADAAPIPGPTLLVPLPDHVIDDPEPEIPMPATPATPEPPAVDDGIDALTGLPDASAFSRLVADEDARIARYHRAATVVVFELEGLDRLVERLGDDAGDRIIPAVADTLRRLARAADHVARLGPGRFGALLPETDEVAAINYIERVRKACDLWLETGAIAMRLAIGWAGTAGDPPLTDAQRTATERMYAELRRGQRRAGIADEAPAAESPAAPPAPPAAPPAAS
jgi:diguanylate cyclase (GGDEF)-like protein